MIVLTVTTLRPVDRITGDVVVDCIDFKAFGLAEVEAGGSRKQRCPSVTVDSLTVDEFN